MARLYLFAVGGTGARVLRALTHLLGAGAELRDFMGQRMELVPLVIDPDEENGDTLDSLQTLVSYSDLRSKHLGAKYKGGFFGTQISRYRELQTDTLSGRGPDEPPTKRSLEHDSFRCGIVDKEKAQTFSKVIGYDHLRPKTRLLLDALYSQENFRTNLSGGFLGNPNLGTVVLNKVKESEQFKMLPGLFHEEDRIFIISSIFGGTGASGFPVLVKLLRDAKDAQGHQMTVLREAPIGALTVLPYFSVKPDEQSPIDSNAFIPKTKAALAYYVEHLDGIQAMYYIGDKTRKIYENRPTGEKQYNDDHIIELIGATAVLHFAARVGDSRSEEKSFEFAVSTSDFSRPLTFASLGDDLGETVAAPLTSFALATRFLQETTQASQLPRLLAQPWVREGRFDRGFFNTAKQGMRYHALQTYTDLWWESFAKLATNDPAFEPFGGSLHNLRSDLGTVTLNTNEMNKALNSIYNGAEHGDEGTLQRLLGMLWEASVRLCATAYQSGALKV
jgi:hypothetical protein